VSMLAGYRESLAGPRQEARPIVSRTAGQVESTLREVQAGVARQTGACSAELEVDNPKGASGRVSQRRGSSPGVAIDPRRPMRPTHRAVMCLLSRYPSTLIAWCCLEATVGFEPTHRGFAEPGSRVYDPCSPLAGFRTRVSAFRAAWRLRAARPSEGPAFPVWGSVQWGG